MDIDMRQAAAAVSFFVAFFAIAIAGHYALEMIEAFGLKPTWWWQLRTWAWGAFCVFATLVLAVDISSKPTKNNPTA